MALGKGPHLHKCPLGTDRGAGSSGLQSRLPGTFSLTVSPAFVVLQSLRGGGRSSQATHPHGPEVARGEGSAASTLALFKLSYAISRVLDIQFQRYSGKENTNILRVVCALSAGSNLGHSRQ